MTNQVDRTINITIKEVELVEVLKKNHGDALADIETKADKEELDNLKNTVSENQTQLREQLQSQSELINAKLDEATVRRMIAESELNDLTLEEVQREIIKQVADKASSQAVNDANQAQDAKISKIEQSLADKANTSALDELKEQLAALVGSGIEDKSADQRVDEIARSVETKADKDHAHSVGDITGLTETLASKADATHAHSLDDIKGLNDKLSTLASSETVTALQEQVQSHSELISGKLDEEAVKALIAEAELDDLTLERVQQEIITRVADKASTQAVAEANEVQDAKIDNKADTSYVDNIKQSLQDKDNEIEQSLAGKANAVHTHSFNDITDKPETYTPSEHNHTVDDITGLNERLSALVTNETLQNLLKQYAIKTTVEQLQNSLEAKADNTQLESLRELIQSVSSELGSANLGDLTNKASKDEVNTLKDELTSLIGTKASDTVSGIVKLSHKTDGTDKTVAVSEYALGKVVEELTAKIQKLSDQLQEVTAHTPKETRDAPDPASARAEESVIMEM